MKKINIGLIGFGTVGSGVVKFLKDRNKYIKDKYNAEFAVKSICDLRIDKIKSKETKGIHLTKDYKDIINDSSIKVVVELIGGLHPAKEIAVKCFESGKHLVTANKALISNFGKELFKLAQKNKCHLYFESSVGAGIPTIKTISEGVVGNKFKGIYGIVNGTCNYILTEMTKKGLSFSQALKEAQVKGYAESDPTLDINGMDSAHKLAILINLAFGKFINVKEIYTEGITHISHEDIVYAEGLGLTIKLLAITKREGDEIEARVHPTLISKEHPLASINGINNAVFFDTEPLGDVLLSGEGAGQMAAASGIISDLINYASKDNDAPLYCNLYSENPKLKIMKLDNTKSRFYIKFMAIDKPGVLSKLSGILGKHNIGINSVKQNIHDRAKAVPVIVLTNYATEKMVRLALAKIDKLSIVKSKTVAIRIEDL